MKILSLAVLLAAGASASADQWHPEWGPEPPVAPYTKSKLPSQHVVAPIVFPLIGAARWNDDYGANRGAFRHTGIDIKAPKMTPIVAPLTGTLGMKVDTFWIYADTGWAVLGTHLNDDNPGRHDHKGGWDLMFGPNIHAGMHVRAGQFLGYVGESGDAHGPHLHFELYAPGEGLAAARIRDPFPSLKHALVLKAPLPVIDRVSDRPPKGEVRLEGCVRKVDADRKALTLLVFAHQAPNGHVTTMTQPEYVRVELDKGSVSECGGWDAFGGMERAEVLTAYVLFEGRNKALARKIVLPPSFWHRLGTAVVQKP